MPGVPDQVQQHTAGASKPERDSFQPLASVGGLWWEIQEIWESDVWTTPEVLIPGHEHELCQATDWGQGDIQDIVIWSADTTGTPQWYSDHLISVAQVINYYQMNYFYRILILKISWECQHFFLLWLGD